MKQKKVLILGGAGFIGLGIAKYLGANREYEITIADIFSSEQKDSDLNQVVYDYSIKIFEKCVSILFFLYALLFLLFHYAW